VGGRLYIYGNDVLINLCALYNVNLDADNLYIYDNSLLSMDTANALEAQLIINGFTGPSYIRDNFGTVQVFCDNDDDTVYDDTDNCPNVANLNQADADLDDTGDACDKDTVYGTISGDIQEGIIVNIYILSCGVPQPHANVTTDAQGYYAIGNLDNARYLVSPDDAGYSFSSSYWVDIQQAVIQSFDFTSTAD
jgi:hypothetical protein